MVQGSQTEAKQLPSNPSHCSFDSAVLIQTLYGALTSREGFHPFLQQLACAINASSALLVGYDRASIRAEYLWYSNVPEDFLHWYLKNNMAESDPVVQAALRQGVGQGHFQSVIPLLADFKPGENFKKFERDLNWMDAAWLVADASDQITSLLIIQRTTEQGTYQPQELALLDQLVPFIRQALQLYRRANRQAEFAVSMAAVLDALPGATFVLNDEAVVLYSNAIARQLVSAESVVRLENSRLTLLRTGDQKLFLQQLVETIRASMGQQAFHPNTLVIDRPDKPGLIVTMSPVEGFDIQRGGVLVTVYDPARRKLPAAEDIADYFSLTQAESLLCEDLIAGLSLKEIAERRHKSEATLRSYLKQIFAKTGLNRQGQLISVILAALMV